MFPVLLLATVLLGSVRAQVAPLGRTSVPVLLTSKVTSTTTSPPAVVLRPQPTCKTMKFRQLPSYNDKIIQNLRMQTEVSNAHCAGACSRHGQCLAYFYNKRRKTCGLKTKLISIYSLQPEPGYKYYEATCRDPSYKINWELGVCVRLFAKNNVWDDAIQTCRNHGGSLLNVDTMDKLKAIRHLMKTPEFMGTYFLWTAGRKHNGTFRWSDGRPVNSTLWAPGQPDGTGDLCIIVPNHGQNFSLDGYLDDTFCISLCRPLCQMDIAF